MKTANRVTDARGLFSLQGSVWGAGALMSAKENPPFWLGHESYKKMLILLSQYIILCFKLSI